MAHEKVYGFCESKCKVEVPSKQELDSRVPAVTTSDNGKFLRVVNGVWTATTVTDGEGVSY